MIENKPGTVSLFGNSVARKVLSLPEQLVLDMLLKGARRVVRWILLGDSLGQRLQDDLLLWRLAENRPRYPHFLLVDEPPVENTLVLAIAQDLYGVTNVHDDGAGHAFRSHPFAFVEELQAGHHVV